MTTFTDDFTRANATTLGANWTRIEGTDFFEIVSNQAKWVAGSYTYERYNAASAAAADMFGQVYMTSAGGSNHYPGVLARCSTSDLSAYALSFASVLSGWGIFRYTGTGASEIQIGATTAASLTNGVTYKMRLEVSGTGATVTLKGYVDDVLTVDTTDSSAGRLTTGTQAGMTTSGDLNYIFDDFSGGDLGGGTPGRMFLARAKA